MVRSVLAVTALFTLVGCATVDVDGVMLTKSRWTEDSETIRRRAAFEMPCPAESIELRVLKEYTGFGFLGANAVGAAGCGHRLVYVLSVRGAWVLNSSDAQVRQ